MRQLSFLATVLAYIGGIVVAAVGILCTISIIGRTFMGRPLLGDFELVEMGIFIAGGLFLPYCQQTKGHLVVDFFTLKVSARTIDWLDRLGNLLVAIMLLLLTWRAAIYAYSLWRGGDTTMLLGIPLWIAYLFALPGVIVAGAIGFLQAACGDSVGEAPND